MKIILVASGSKGKNVVFASDTLRTYSLEEAARLAKEGKFENVYAVEGKRGAYLRTKRSTLKNEQLEQLAVSSRQLVTVTRGLRNVPSTPPALNRYLQLYEASLNEKGGPYPNDPKLSPENIGKVSRAYLHKFVKEPKHSIFFAAARMHALTDEWKKFANLSSMPEIITTLYHLPYKSPHGNPEANPRGLQISSEFYRFAKVWLQ